MLSMSRVPPPLPPSKRPLDRAQGDLSEAELAALLPPESDEDDEAHPKPPPLPGKATVKASTIPPPLPPGMAKGTTAIVPPPLPGSTGVVSVVPPPIGGTEVFDPDANLSKQKQPQGLTEQQKSLLYILIGSFLGAILLIALLFFISGPAKVSELGEPSAPIENPDIVSPTESKPRNTFDLESESDPQFIDIDP